MATKKKTAKTTTPKETTDETPASPPAPAGTVLNPATNELEPDVGQFSTIID